jgi:hypothetical protein
MTGHPTLSNLLLRFVEGNPDQRERGETAQEWVDSMWKKGNPAVKMKKSVEDFLVVFESFDGLAAIGLRDTIEPLTK